MLAISVFVLIEGLGRCVAAARSVQNYSVSEILLANKSYEFRTERRRRYSRSARHVRRLPRLLVVAEDLSGRTPKDCGSRRSRCIGTSAENRSAIRWSSTGICPKNSGEHAVTQDEQKRGRGFTLLEVLLAVTILEPRHRRRVQHVERGVELLAARQRCQRSLSAATHRHGCADRN